MNELIMEKKEKAYELLKTYFGYNEFRPNQYEVIEHALAGNDGLVIMPTGGGKSLCFQIPALMLDGVTIVVSPLIALMQDQVSGLNGNGIKAYSYNSHSSSEEIVQLKKSAVDGSLKLLYVSPEKLNTQSFFEFVREFKVSLVAVDEAHCVSVWGNDFRPDYTYIHRFRDQYANVPFLALTATADTATQEDIVAQLHLKNSNTFLSSFERTNITMYAEQGLDRINKIFKFIGNNPGSGIIYCLSRKSTEEVAQKLNDRGIPALFYHAKMTPEDRSDVQKAFLEDRTNIICATIAFGMGIDKSNIRWVIHYNMPKNLEGFYQEIGRAGRDGLPAKSLLYYSYGDLEIYKDFISKGSATDEFKEVQSSKLERMWEFSNSSGCRTNVILNYFCEYTTRRCGHCDNCLQPPKFFDGSVLAQKALSAIIKCKEELTIQLLVDVLRGSMRKEITEKGYDAVSPFGVGRDESAFAWREYIVQMMHKGIVRMDFTNGSRLKATPLSADILYGKSKIELVKPSFETPETKKAEKPKVRQDVDGGLLDKIKAWRLQKSREEGVPPYIIFNDSTLKLITDQKPSTLDELNDISGVGAMKLKKYGEEILEIVLSDKKIKKILKSEAGNTYEKTRRLLDRGFSADQIAEDRQISKDTVISHLIYLHENGELIDFSSYITAEELKLVDDAYSKLENPEGLKSVFEYLEEKVTYIKIRIALALRKKGV